MAKILVIDDEENIRKTLDEILSDEAHEVVSAGDGNQGLRALKEELPDVVLLDIQLPGRDGLEILQEIKSSGVDCEVIMISGHGTIEAAIKAIRLGAYHFLQKPLAMVEVKQNVRHAAEAKLQRDELQSLKEKEGNRYRIVGTGSAVERMEQQIAKVAPTPGRVLITGQSGSGKELVAYAIHRQSQRASGPFVKINCAAIPQNLIESELFGHERGSFTGAVSLKKGKFETAHLGTLFLDEIGDMDLNTQTKVLRVIQEGEFERVGGIKTIKVDVRIVAATHRDLEAMIAARTFREDLYYRLNVVPIRVPTLAERTEDIPALAQYFLELYCAENSMAKKSFASEALSLLCARTYKGNIRELKNIVERAAILTEAPVISAAALQALIEIKQEANMSLFTRTRPLNQAKDELERVYVQTQLELNEWNIPRTADLLDMQRTNLHRKIKQLGIER
ncbi:MAG: hypothetical protein A2248_08910 [Candidatus Raymondbacteria bacterium RIFOXYA2_FULL_49_16]|uniref:Fis family transcriptional regulator n=1 Tax=Candidatus Raymondbacteria bacterium RIFOXYD12_FULL_49_13 TaxID=1817890 RepID=A0A1F7F3J5_UNCRA|nr:MAG: hypothetical protein A2248_08910 [Candidatus Raymondbacteria bacterium RIFOXYA2_FULL_49_16]OGK01133.1 MAG: hypothetical protein A2519_20440 [Candidatus Raymondbacteria bacterium RIFOXYD12_FULL_49_13]OGP39354.1 MAG: hypothetical protein A2324_16950 [Candidatus Raymondbacteria bacterium RIFOXYB2_FULL_49_35]